MSEILFLQILKEYKKAEAEILKEIYTDLVKSLSPKKNSK
jgi:hypothetical protein